MGTFFFLQSKAVMSNYTYKSKYTYLQVILLYKKQPQPTNPLKKIQKIFVGEYLIMVNFVILMFFEPKLWGENIARYKTDRHKKLSDRGYHEQENKNTTRTNALKMKHRYY